MAQRLNHDVDLDTMPILAYNAKVVKNGKAGNGFMVQNQVRIMVLTSNDVIITLTKKNIFSFKTLLFILIDTLLGTCIWKLYWHPRYVLKHKLYLEIICIIGHWTLAYQIGFWPWLGSAWILSNYSFLNFALSHSFLPVTTEPTHWVEYAFIHTTDIDPRQWCSWWMGYLNYQIEHHLFPAMPPFRHPLIKERVKALAEKHNLPYMVYSYPEAVQKTFQNLSHVAKELKH